MAIENPVDTYKGLAVPLDGNSRIRQRNSTGDFITLEHSSANTGRFMVFRDYIADGQEGPSTATGSDLAYIDADGRYRQNREVVAVTTGADYQITSTQSGSIFSMGASDGTSQALLVPVNPTPGFWFDVYVSTQDEVGDVQVNTTADSSAKILLPGLTSAASTIDSVEPATTLGAHYARFTAVSSILWVAEPAHQNSAGFSSGAIQAIDLTNASWQAATTAA